MRSWFLNIILSTNVSVRVCVCSKAINNKSLEGTRNKWIMKFYGYSISLYDTAIDKLNSRGLSNTAGHEHL